MIRQAILVDLSNKTIQAFSPNSTPNVGVGVGVAVAVGSHSASGQSATTSGGKGAGRAGSGQTFKYDSEHMFSELRVNIERLVDEYRQYNALMIDHPLCTVSTLSDAILDTFLNVMVSLFGNYRLFSRINKDFSIDFDLLLEDALLNIPDNQVVKKQSVRDLFKRLRTTKHLSMFLAERSATYRQHGKQPVLDNEFEIRCANRYPKEYGMDDPQHAKRVPRTRIVTPSAVFGTLSTASQVKGNTQSNSASNNGSSVVTTPSAVKKSQSTATTTRESHSRPITVNNVQYVLSQSSSQLTTPVYNATPTGATTNNTGGSSSGSSSSASSSSSTSASSGKSSFFGSLWGYWSSSSKGGGPSTPLSSTKIVPAEFADSLYDDGDDDDDEISPTKLDSSLDTTTAATQHSQHEQRPEDDMEFVSDPATLDIEREVMQIIRNENEGPRTFDPASFSNSNTKQITFSELHLRIGPQQKQQQEDQLLDLMSFSPVRPNPSVTSTGTTLLPQQQQQPHDPFADDEHQQPDLIVDYREHFETDPFAVDPFNNHRENNGRTPTKVNQQWDDSPF